MTLTVLPERNRGRLPETADADPRDPGVDRRRHCLRRKQEGGNRGPPCGSGHGLCDGNGVLSRADGASLRGRADGAARRCLDRRRPRRRDRHGDEDAHHPGADSRSPFRTTRRRSSSCTVTPCRRASKWTAKLRFINTTSNPVITNGKPTTVDIRVSPRAVTRRALVLLCLLAHPVAAQVPSRVACAGSPAAQPAVDSARLMSDLATLADDSMEGRQVGTAGGARARRFVEGRFRAIGLDTLSTGVLERFTVPGRTGRSGANIIGLVPGRSRPG